MVYLILRGHTDIFYKKKKKTPLFFIGKEQLVENGNAHKRREVSVTFNFGKKSYGIPESIVFICKHFI